MATTEQTEPGHVIVHGTASGFAQEVEIGSHELYADEPPSYGGTDSGPSPYDLLLAALGSCTSMTIGFYARKRRWPLEKITVSLRHSKIHAIDCEECETKEGRIDRIELDVQLTGSLTDEQRAKLMEIAGKCPVHQTLTSEINIKSRLI
ncbi:MAG TPA: OsmC family protein [Chthoniobacterales bacterium]|jgi:putative redox protein|nr:OsmC family protein [Chthoniobacterales bacterium]